MSFETISRSVHAFKKRTMGQLIARLKHGRVTFHGSQIQTPKWFDPTAMYLLYEGRYEIAEASLILAHVPTNSPVIELGGSIGAVSSVIRKKVGPDAPHVIVEANPDLEGIIAENCGDKMGTTHIEIAAIDYSGSTSVQFSKGTDMLANRVDGAATDFHTVPTITLSALCERYEITNYVLVSDIEGAEEALVDHDAAGLKHCKMLIMELHPTLDGNTLYDKDTFVAKLAALGFVPIAEYSTVICMARPE